MKQYHFITGLPRSGSTLLTAILNQNPTFHSSISDGVAALVRSTIDVATMNPGFKSECPPERVKNILLGLFDGYYKEINKPVIFNTNRAWTALSPISSDLYPNAKYITCVRDIGWILDSFERLMRKNSFKLTTLWPKEDMASVYTRCKSILQEGRTVGQPYNGLKQALVSELKDRFLIVEYNDLSTNPEKIMRQIYDFIGLPYFNHDFNNVESSYDEYDIEIGMKGLHDTRKKVEYVERETILPPDIWQSVKGWEFWRDESWFEMASNIANAKPSDGSMQQQRPQNPKKMQQPAHPGMKKNPLKNDVLPVSSFLKK